MLKLQREARQLQQVDLPPGITHTGTCRKPRTLRMHLLDAGLPLLITRSLGVRQTHPANVRQDCVKIEGLTALQTGAAGQVDMRLRIGRT